MKTALNTLNEVLTFQLESMHDGEKRIQQEIPEFISHLTSPEAIEIMSKYADSAKNKRMKIKRIFGYLLTGPFGRTSAVVEKSLTDCRNAIERTRRGNYRDILFTTDIEAMTQYKIACYNTALKLALQLDLAKVVEILEEVVSWEIESARELSDFISRNVRACGSLTISVG